MTERSDEDAIMRSVREAQEKASRKLGEAKKDLRGATRDLQKAVSDTARFLQEHDASVEKLQRDLAAMEERRKREGDNT